LRLAEYAIFFAFALIFDLFALRAVGSLFGIGWHGPTLTASLAQEKFRW
jgi:hypothetical protein